MYEETGYMGELPQLGQDSGIDEFIMADTSYVGKVSQTEVSIPLAMASVGNEDYIDMYNEATRSGFNIGTPGMSGVVLDDNDYGTPTGFASNTTASPIQQKVINYAKKYGVDPDFALRWVRQESGFNPNAKSKAGAMGLLQLMPATAKELGVTDPFNEDQNLDAGFRYYTSKVREFGDPALALVAYNAGSGNVKKYGGVPPFSETTNYVNSILGKGAIQNNYPVTFMFNNSRINFLDKDMGRLSVSGMDKFIELMNTPIYKNNLKYIYTNAPELLENKKEYTDFAKFRAMKGADGKPLFRKGAGFEGFKVMVTNQAARQLGVLNKNAIPALADDAVKTQTNAINTVSRDSAEALISTFSNRPLSISAAFKSEGIFDSQNFGLANLTTGEYMDYGVPIGALNNPVMQARVLTQEFQRAIDILGSERKAIYALAGGEFVEQNSNTRKSWSEIKQDQKNFMKNWFIKPSEDDAQRDEINALVAQYNAAQQKLRGM